MSTLDAALQQLEAVEANLDKLDKIWAQISKLIPSGPDFSNPPEYDNLCLAFRRILPSLPAIDGWRPSDKIMGYDEIGQARLDALEIDEFSGQVALENHIFDQGNQLREYRFRFDAKRRELVRSRVLELINQVEQALEFLGPLSLVQDSDFADSQEWQRLGAAVAEINTLIGSSIDRPGRWSDLHRHIHFAAVGDLRDILKHDWPDVSESLKRQIYGQHDPLPVDIKDIGELVAAKPSGSVPTRLDWSSLNDEDYERLIFSLIAEDEGYQNVQWLQHTRAPDRGRDLSANRVYNDKLAGMRSERVIIQCKHWLADSVGPTDISAVRDLMPLWQPPRVDLLIIATSGRFTADAIALVEQHNQSDRAMRIEMWPDSHIERLLAARPHLVAEFRLKRTT